jgi:transposase
VTIVMGLDQHRGQITAEWLDTATGEVSRARVAPAHREPVARFLNRFREREIEVALEATTGWRFVVEELRRVGAEVHLAEPAETAARRGSKKRAKSDRADARHLRELLMISRLPESWIAPDHLLDLRARVRLRHTLSDQRGEWQQRIQAVLYHYGLPPRRQLMIREGRAWLAQAPLPDTAREQVTVAVAMVDELDVQLAPIDRELRALARRQPGCRALMGHYGIGELTAVTILAELGDCRRFSSSRHAVRYAGLDIPCTSPISAAPPAISRARDRPRCAGRCSRPPKSRGAPVPRPRVLPAGSRAPRRQPRLPGDRAQAAQAQLPHPVRARRGGATARLRTCSCARSPSSHRCTAAGSRQPPAATCPWTALKDQAAATRSAGSPHQPSCRRPGATPGRGPR